MLTANMRVADKLRRKGKYDVYEDRVIAQGQTISDGLKGCPREMRYNDGWKG